MPLLMLVPSYVDNHHESSCVCCQSSEMHVAIWCFSVIWGSVVVPLQHPAQGLFPTGFQRTYCIQISSASFDMMDSRRRKLSMGLWRKTPPAFHTDSGGFHRVVGLKLASDVFNCHYLGQPNLNKHTLTKMREKKFKQEHLLCYLDILYKITHTLKQSKNIRKLR